MIQLLGASEYGYEIIRGVRKGFKGSWETKTGTVYPALRALEKKGIIAKSVVAEKTHYSLTDTGGRTMQ